MILNGDAIQLNYGGFVPLSTVDWRGRSVCTVFFRGCPVRCTYCQNAAILNGQDFREIDEVIALINGSKLAISGVVFSGGEPTMQKDALIALARAARNLGLATGVQTNGVFPDTLETLIKDRLLDRVALDIKARWARYNNLFGGNYVKNVQRSLALCTEAHKNGALPEFQVVVTLFRGYDDEVAIIASEIGDADLILQQGVTESVPPLSEKELKNVADGLPRRVLIRTREGGEIVYESDRSRRASRKR
ncbi:MAG: anaerobic ribonucleoside-triphosphate reductase activating protein [Methanoregula sp.]|jgi:pyruvate formate lyase activating enzyme|uniref:anaerobic ribonucleoside-triphosphate reductase activating protein n=1 Tax=Methanoregula sp. TaxID=2052170 RepID=UPI003D113E8F